MSQSLVKRIITMEQEAEQRYTEAQKQAENLIKEAHKATAALREQTLSEARRQAERIMAEEQAKAEAEQQDIIRQADAEARRMEQTAALHFDRAVEYVLNQVAGGSAASPDPEVNALPATSGKD